jgi:PAS domain S-box-containing protein
VSAGHRPGGSPGQRPGDSSKPRPARGPGRKKLLAQIAELEERLQESEEALRAIREGEVDAIVVSGRHGEQIYSLAGSDLVYRLIVQSMSEAALTTTLGGTILFCNAQFGTLLGAPMEELVGQQLAELVFPEDGNTVAALVRDAASRPVKRRVLFRGKKAPVPALVSVTPLDQPDGSTLCWVAADLTELESSAAVIQELNRKQEQLEKSTERFGVLSETAGNLLRSKEPQAIVNALCRRVMEILRCKCYFNYLLAEDGKSLHLNAHGGIPEKTASAIQTLELGQAVCGWVAQNGEPMVAKSVQAGSDPRTDLVRALGIDAYACHPLVSNGKVIGTLSFGSQDRPCFDADELALMKTVADQVAIAMERAQTEEALERMNEELEARVGRRTEELLRANAELERTTAQLRNLARELAVTEQRERRRLADMLHDHLQQLLVGARYQMELLGGGTGQEVRETIARIDDLLRQAIEVSRSLTAELSPPVLHTLGLGPSLQWLAQRLGTQLDLEVTLAIPPELPPMGEEVTIQLFQSVRELLFNVVKHAQVKTASLQVSEDCGLLCFEVSDAGVGFDPATLGEKVGTESFGIFSIRERLGLIGGRLEIDSRPGAGSRFTIVVPASQP